MSSYKNFQNSSISSETVFRVFKQQFRWSLFRGMDQDNKYSIVSTKSIAYSNIKAPEKIFTVLSHQAFSNL